MHRHPSLSYVWRGGTVVKQRAIVGDALTSRIISWHACACQGVCFDEQVVGEAAGASCAGVGETSRSGDSSARAGAGAEESIPEDEHDRRVDAVLTPTRLFGDLKGTLTLGRERQAAATQADTGSAPEV